MRKVIATVVLASIGLVGLASPALAVSQAKGLSTPYGTLTSNVWRQTGNGSVSGNTRQWDYQVSAVYSGNYTVERIRTTWYAQASLRSSASMNLGISSSGVTVGSSSSWQNARTPSKYWENTNGSKSSSYRSNIVEGPAIHYLNGTIFTVNTALLKIRGDARIFQINAGV
jgi:hypothetical protein